MLTRPQLVLLGNDDAPTKADGNNESKLSKERSPVSVSLCPKPVYCNAFSMPPNKLLKIDSGVLVDGGDWVDVEVAAKKSAIDRGLVIGAL